ncbi:PREDICTED: uncharacterized protein LOC106813169 [Priapulus caudatus]|uniref:Uncharacterized protein LOC106813169 n=1 Tax=Priapulus caudatus TaxID=37621 RepID=A0ABM1EKK3_PRICU|nr:PREDICTED: uncharacterized protein LOC106813169 [Priapulus caudatus]
MSVIFRAYVRGRKKRIAIVGALLLPFMYFVGVHDVLPADLEPPTPPTPPTFHLELVVLTYDRPHSLRRLLDSLEAAEYDGDAVTLRICIDGPRDEGARAAHAESVDVARRFSFSHGKKLLDVRESNVGAYVQWFDCWRPGEAPHAYGIILEDDLRVSPYFYRWLKPALLTYADNPQVGGVTLQRGTLVARSGKHRNPLCVGCGDTAAFLYRLLGTWGFAPMPRQWRRFQRWVHEAMKDAEFVPYVRDARLITNAWLRKRHSIMKTMPAAYTIHYLAKNQLYTVYANLPDNATLACNHREAGMNYRKNHGDIVLGECDFEPLRHWEKRFTEFPYNPVRLGWDALPESDMDP